MKRMHVRWQKSPTYVSWETLKSMVLGLAGGEGDTLESGDFAWKTEIDSVSNELSSALCSSKEHFTDDN